MKNDAGSTLTSIKVTWSSVADTAISTTGYKLYMDGGNDGNYTMIYDGSNSPGTLEYTATGLNTNSAYNFYLVAVNFNGDSPASSTSLLYSCLPPTGLAPVEYSSSTATTLTVKWNAPAYNNGCPLISYKLYRDDGAAGTITNLVGTYEPHTDEATVTLTGADTSKTYRF